MSAKASWAHDVAASANMPTKAESTRLQRRSKRLASAGPAGCARASVVMKAATGSPATMVDESEASKGRISLANTVKKGRNNSSDKATRNTVSRSNVSWLATADGMDDVACACVPPWLLSRASTNWMLHSAASRLCACAASAGTTWRRCQRNCTRCHPRAWAKAASGYSSDLRHRPRESSRTRTAAMTRARTKSSSMPPSCRFT